MEKLGLLVCTNSAIDYVPHDFKVGVIRSTVLLGDKEYVDYEELKAEEFYEKVLADPTLIPRTAMASTGTMLKFYEELKEEGCDTIIFVTISQKMSGIYENALLAAKMLDGVDIRVFDSKAAGYIEVLMIFAAQRAYKAGKSIDEIMKELEFIRDNSHLYFAVNNLTYLVKNGRLSNAAGFVANMLKIKPLLEVDKEGAVVSVEKIRTFSKAVDRVIEKFLADTEGKDVLPFVIHALNPETAEYMKKKILEVRPEYKEINDYLLTPAVGAHIGPKAVCIGYVLKK